MDSVLSEKWFKLSLVQQMVNIGNEVKRALKFSADADKKNLFIDRAIPISFVTSAWQQKISNVLGMLFPIRIKEI